MAKADAAEEIVKITEAKKAGKKEFSKTFHGPEALKDKQVQEAILNQGIERR